MSAVPVLFFGLFGLFIGSFLNVCIYRIPIGVSVAAGRSKCTACGNVIKWYDLIPVLSYLALRGTCKNCKSKISPIYPAVELLTGFLWALSRAVYGYTPAAALTALLLSVLLVITFIDLKHMIIPDSLAIMVAALGLINSLAVSGEGIPAHVIGVFAVSVPLLIAAVVSKGGLGGGDIKLMAEAGLFLGYKLILLSLLIGSVAGAIVSLILLARNRAGLKTEIPFGPYLSLGIAVSALFGNRLIELYLGLIL